MACSARYQALLALRSSVLVRTKSTGYAKEFGNGVFVLVFFALFCLFVFPLGILYQPKGAHIGFRQVLSALLI